MGVCVCFWVRYHDNSKLRASILTKLGLLVKVMIISCWLNFGHPAPTGRGSAAGRNFWLRLTTASAQCLRLLRALFHYYIICKISDVYILINNKNSHHTLAQYTGCANKVAVKMLLIFPRPMERYAIKFYTFVTHSIIQLFALSTELTQLRCF